MENESAHIRKASRGSFFLYVNILAGVTYLTVIFTPYLVRHMLFDITIPVVLLWIASGFLHAPKAMRPNLVLLLMGVFVAWVATTRALGHGSASWGNLGSMILYFLPTWMYYYYKRLGNDNLRHGVVIVSLIVLALNVVDNIRLLSIYPWAAKFLTGGFYTERISQLNVGTLPFTSGVAILVPTLLALGQQCKGRRVHVHILVAVMIWYVYLSLSAITLIVCMIGVGSLYFLPRRQASTEVLLARYCICAAVLILSIAYVPDILISVARLTNSPALYERFASIAQAIQGDIVEGSSLIARLRNLVLSLVTFFQNPMFGVGFEASQDRFATGIGMHSQVVDDMARFGMIGMLLNWGAHFRFLIHRVHQGSPITSGVRASYFIFFLIALFNPSSSPETGAVLFLLLPSIADLSDGTAG